LYGFSDLIPTLWFAALIASSSQLFKYYTGPDLIRQQLF